MNSKFKLFVVWFCASILVGFVAKPLVSESEADSTGSEVLASLAGGLGQGISLAALGGYRNVAANFVWISMYGDWQYRRKEKVLEKMHLAVSLNPDSLYFWIDGSRIIANDMPVWQVGDDLMESLFRGGESVEVRMAYGEKALSFLDQAPEEIAGQVSVLVEKGAICWRRLEDLDRAIQYFERAINTPGVPYYVCRVYAELLYRNGKKREAFEYLKTHYDTLPDNNPSAMKALVRNRIEELQMEL